MSTTGTKWSESYMQGIIDVACNKVNEEIIENFAYYLQSQHISSHPDCILFYEDVYVENQDMFEQYEAYTKGVLETADEKFIYNISYIFNKVASEAVEDYDIEASHLDENYEGLQELQYIAVEHKTRTIYSFVPRW